MKLILKIILYVVLTSITSYAQFRTPKFEHFTVTDGLPENSVSCIMQDHLGYMWLGTQSGLVQYDGYNLRVYKNEPDNDRSISNGMILCLSEDSKGNFWVGTGYGLNCLDRINGSFTRYNYDSTNPASINSNWINCIYEDSKGRLLIGTDKGLNLFDYQSKQFRHFYFKELSYQKELYDHISRLSKSNKTIQAILEVGDNADLKKSFHLKQSTHVLIVMMGEEDNDYGWIEDENGDVVFEYDNKLSCYAGGSIINRIQVKIDTLPAGNYSMHYVSNLTYSYKSNFLNNQLAFNWPRFTAPDYEQNWGIQVFRLSGEIKKLIYSLDSLQNTDVNANIFSIIENPVNKDLLIGCNRNGFWKLDENEKVLINNHIKPESDYKKNIGFIKTFFKDKQNSLWIASSQGIIRINPSNNSYKMYQVSPSDRYLLDNHMHCIIEGSDGLIYSGSGIGLAQLIQLNPVTGILSKYYPSVSVESSVISLAVDKSGILWTGTWLGGIYKWSTNKFRFEHFTITSLNSKGVNDQSLNTIFEDEYGITWIGTYSALISYDRKNNNYRYFHHQEGNTNSLSSDSIQYIIGDPSDKEILWIGTFGRGLDRFDTKNGSFKHYKHNESDTTSLSDNYVLVIEFDRSGNPWIGTVYGGLNKLDRIDDKFIRYESKYNFSIAQNSFVGWIKEDRKGLIWVGVPEATLYYVEPESKKIKRYLPSIKGLNTDNITWLLEDKYGNFWLGTFLNGVILFDKEKGRVLNQLTTSNGLLNNTVRFLFEDNSGNIWIRTSLGLQQYNPRTKLLKNFDPTDSLVLAGSSIISNFYQNKNGEVFIGGTNGFNIFHPDSIKDDPISPQVVIENISLFNRPDEKLDYEGFIPELDMIELPYNQNDLHFEYVGLHFSEPAKNKYKYILEGFDKNWIDAGNLRTATYTNLDPGEYTFRVNAANRDGVWNETGASIKIIINPPMWATMWAYLLYMILAASLIYFLWKLNVRRIKTKHEFEMSKFEAEKLHEVDELKSKFFANISHEFRTPLTLILGPAKDVLGSTKESKTKQSVGLIERNASRLLGLVNQLLDLSKLEVGRMKLETREENIIPLLRGLVMSFASLADSKKIILNFSSTEENLNVYLDKDKIEKIINNLLSNAFKFTPKGGKIEVTVERNIKEIEIRISDSGIGIPEENIDKIFDRFYQVDGSHTREQEGTGIGLALTKELVELHKGKIEVDSKAGKGTTFIVRIPLGKDHLKQEENFNDKVKEEASATIDEQELIIENNFRKEKTDIDVLLEPGKPLLLVVEDNSDVRKYIISHLEVHYRIQEAVDGEDGLKQAFNHIPDLIISDVMMPKMDGFEMCNKLKTDERTSHIPIIMLTAKATSHDKISGYEIGADEYIMKPFDAIELKVRVKNLIDIRKKLQEKFRSADFTLPTELGSIDEQFMKRVLNVINEHISEEKFSIDELGKEIAMSREHLYRKLKAITGHSPSLFMRSVRLAKAKKLIIERKGTISEISFLVGFSSPAYFGKCFKEEFGFSPGEL